MRKKTKKTDNNNLEAKLNLRRYYLKKYPIKSVADLCAGSEVIWTQLKTEFEISVVHFDRLEKKGRVKINSIRMIPGLEVDAWDIDTYGSPWAHYFEVLKKKKEAVIFMTIESVYLGSQPSILFEERIFPKCAKNLKGLHKKMGKEFYTLAIAHAYRFGLQVENYQEINFPQVKYCGFILRNIAEKP